MSRTADRTMALLRLGLFACLVAALWGPRLAGVGATPALLLVRDLSASMGRSVGAPAEGDPGSDAPEWLAVADGLRWVSAGNVPGGLPRGASTLGAALAEVAARHPGRDVLLISDGRASDDAEAGARALRAAGGRLLTQPPLVPAADVGLLAARLERLGPGGPARATVTLGGSVAGRVRVTLLLAGRARAAEEVTLVPGGRLTLRLEDPAPPEGATSALVRLEALAGTPNDDPENDALALGLAPRRASVAVWGDLGLEALRGGTEGPEVARLEEPDEGALGAADLVVVAGLAWSAIGPARTEALARFVAAGGRVLLLGGPSAYAPGGWGGTRFEAVLAPLRVPSRPTQGASIVVALDVSGSTSGEPLAALRRAAHDALMGLQPGERLAVLPFRAAVDVRPLPPGFVEVGDADASAVLGRALDGLLASGPTDLGAGLAAGVALLESTPRGGERRLLLLTDGDPDERPDAERLAALAPRLAAAQVRFGALVVGMPEAATALRRALAERPEDVQLLDGVQALAPRLLAQLARQRARAESERLGRPAALEPAAGTWAALLASDMPLGWVHDVEAGEGAVVQGHVRMEEAASPPRLFAAERALGAGRVHALAWGPAAAPDPIDATRRLAPLVARLAAEADRGVAADLDDLGRVRVALPGEAGRGRVALVAGPDVVGALEIAPGVFQSEQPLPEALDVRVRGPGFERVLRLPVRPALEHRGSGPDLERLAALAAAGGGRLLARGERVPPAPRRPGLPLAPVFLLGAAILLVLERRRAWRPAPAPAEPGAPS